MYQSTARMATKAWFDRAVFYHIYPLGMLGNHGNGLRKLSTILDYLVNLGVNAIYIGPLFMSSTHGYDTTDYFHVDPRLGSDDDLTIFIGNAHEKGIRVILDGVFNHVGKDFWGFKEALQNGPNSIAWNWFVGLHEDPDAPNGVRYDTWEGHEQLVKLNLQNYDTRAHLFAAIDTWIDKFDIDGIRLDAADCLSKDFIRALRKHVDLKKKDFYLMGEVIHGDYRHWANDEMFDGTTNYEAYKGIWSSHNDKNAFEIAYSLNRQFGPTGIYRGLAMYSFVENHDVVRLASVLKNENDIFSTYALMFLMPGIPSIYYTGEWGKKGIKGNGFDADLPVRPNVEPEDLISGNINDLISNSHELYLAIKKLAACRKSCDDLMFGDYQQIDVQSHHLIFARSHAICAISMYDEQHTVCIQVEPGIYEDILNQITIDASNGSLAIPMTPHWAHVFLRKI